MATKVKLFGAAFDAMDNPERIALRNAWIAALEAGRVGRELPRDPYDAIALPLAAEYPEIFEAAGKLEVPDAFVPRPDDARTSEISPAQYRQLLHNIEFQIMQNCMDFIERNILPDVSCMFAVDHSLSAGAYLAWANLKGKDNVTWIIFDSHFDAIPTRLRVPDKLQGRIFPEKETMNCGNFIGCLIREHGVPAGNIIVIGLADYPPEEKQDDDASVRNFREAYLSFIDEGVKVVRKSEALSPSFPDRLEKILDDIRTPNVYISLDADAGSCACMNAVRFMDTVGLDEETIIGAARAIARREEAGRFSIVGADVSEVDVHLLGLTGQDAAPDRTGEVCAEFVKTLFGVCR